MDWDQIINESDAFTSELDDNGYISIYYEDTRVGRYNDRRVEDPTLIIIDGVGIEPALRLIQLLDLKPFTYGIRFTVETTEFHDDFMPLSIVCCNKYKGKRIYALEHASPDCRVKSLTRCGDIGINRKYQFGVRDIHELPDNTLSYYNIVTGRELKRDSVMGLVEYCNQLRQRVPSKSART